MELLDIMILVFGSIISYLLGGISIARLITKKDKGGDIKTQGSGNPGTMNMLRTHGMFMGFFTLICDALKGSLPALFGLYYFKTIDLSLAYTALYLFGLCAVVGHIFPIYYKFKGGKGIATTFGVFMVADPITSIILFGILFVTLYVIKIASVVSLLFVIINAILQFFKSYCHTNWLVVVLIVVMIILDIWAHRTNLLRLIENKENPADLQEGLRKDIEKIKNKQVKKIEKNKQKTQLIKEKYNKKIEKKNNKVNKKIEKIYQANAVLEVQEEPKKEVETEASTKRNSSVASATKTQVASTKKSEVKPASRNSSTKTKSSTSKNKLQNN